MLVYWERLRRAPARSTSPCCEAQTGRHRLPWLAAFIIVSVVGCVLALAAFGPQRAARVLAEWLPTSGGTGGYDPFVRGRNQRWRRGSQRRQCPIATRGMVETDSFLDSPLPSLYDLFNDMYGRAVQAQGAGSAFSLDGQAKANESRKTPALIICVRAASFPRRGKVRVSRRDSSDRAARALSPRSKAERRSTSASPPSTRSMEQVGRKLQ